MVWRNKKHANRWQLAGWLVNICWRKVIAYKSRKEAMPKSIVPAESYHWIKVEIKFFLIIFLVDWRIQSWVLTNYNGSGVGPKMDFGSGTLPESHSDKVWRCFWTSSFWGRMFTRNKLVILCFCRKWVRREFFRRVLSGSAPVYHHICSLWLLSLRSF